MSSKTLGGQILVKKAQYIHPSDIQGMSLGFWDFLFFWSVQAILAQTWPPDPQVWAKKGTSPVSVLRTFVFLENLPGISNS